MRILVAGLCLLLPVAAHASLNEALLQKERECQAKATSFEAHRLCTIRATPRKCRHHVRGQRPEKAMSMNWRRDWLSCVKTCEGVGWYSARFGECSTPNDPNK